MPDSRRRVLVYSSKEDSPRIFEGIRAILSKILDEKKYEVVPLRRDDVVSHPVEDWASGIEALIVNNNGGEHKFDEKVKKAFVEYFLNSGKVVFLSNPTDGQQALWMLKEAAAGEHGVPFPETVALAFEKFAQRQPVPVNLQAFQVHKPTDQNEANLIDYAVGLVRGDSDLSYMYFICEDGDTAIFVVSPSLAAAEDPVISKRDSESLGSVCQLLSAFCRRRPQSSQDRILLARHPPSRTPDRSRSSADFAVSSRSALGGCRRSR